MFKKLFICVLAFIFILPSYGLVFANTTDLVSLSSEGNQSNDFSSGSSLSADGHFVAFASNANNLVDNDSNDISDIFVRDLDNNKTEIVSLSTNGSLIGGFSPSISGDGRYVAFVSSVYHEDKQRFLSQILLRDRVLNVTEVVSINNKSKMANENCGEPVISENGLVVAFSTWANNLVDGMEVWTQNIFVRDLKLNNTERVSIANNGSEPNYNNYEPSISADGQFIAFTSSANNLVANDKNKVKDVFVRDRLNGITERISLSYNGSEANKDSFQPSISADGSLVAFTSQAKNLVPYDNNKFRDVFVRDRINNITVRVSETSLGEGTNLESMDPCISPDGRYVSFNSGYRDLVAGITPESKTELYITNNNNTTATLTTDDLEEYKDIFIKDLFSGEIWKISKPLNGIESDDHSYEPSINRGGSRVSYTSEATNLIINDYNEFCDIYLWSSNDIHFELTGHLSPVSVQSGESVKITAFTSNVAEKVTALIKNTTIDLKFLNSCWEGNYLVPNNEKTGKQIVELEAIDNEGNTANLSLFFNVFQVVTPPLTTIIDFNKTVPRLTIIKKETTLTPNPKPIKNNAKPVYPIIKVINMGINGLSNSSTPLMTNSALKNNNIKKDSSYSYNDKSWTYNNKNSIYGPFVSIFNNANNPFSHIFYAWDKFIQAGQKAWKTGNIWDFFNYPYYHIYGYSNLDKMWGGEAIKYILSFMDIDENGNMSVGGLLINVLSLIPLGRVATLSGRFLSKLLPKAFNFLVKSKSGQFLLKSKTFQALFKATNEYLINPFKWMTKNILAKLPKWLRGIKLGDIWKGVKKFSDLVNFNPKTWMKSIVSTGKWLEKSGFSLKVGKWLSNTGVTKAAGRLYDRLLLGKITRKDLLNIVDGSIKIAKDGLKGGFDFFKGIFSKMTPSSVKYWVHSSPWRMKNLGWLKTITNKKMYKDVQGLLSPVLKRNASLRSVYKAAQTITETIKKAPEIAKKAINTIKSTSKNIVKTTKKIIKKAVQKVSKAVKTVVKKVTKTVKKVVAKVKKAVKKVSKTVKKVVRKVKRTVRKFTKKVKKVAKKVVRKTKRIVKKVVKKVQKTISSGIKWLKNKIKWF